MEKRRKIRKKRQKMTKTKKITKVKPPKWKLLKKRFIIWKVSAKHFRKPWRELQMKSESLLRMLKDSVRKKASLNRKSRNWRKQSKSCQGWNLTKRNWKQITQIWEFFTMTFLAKLKLPIKILRKETKLFRELGRRKTPSRSGVKNRNEQWTKYKKNWRLRSRIYHPKVMK